jgi:hypothetical protein
LAEHTPASLHASNASLVLAVSALEPESMQPLYAVQELFVCDNDVHFARQVVRCSSIGCDLLKPGVMQFADMVSIDGGRQVLDHARIDELRPTPATCTLGGVTWVPADS